MKAKGGRMTLKLILGNKNYSSWSLRPWIAMRHAGIVFDEEVIPLYEPGSREKVLKYSPTGKVPVLVDGDTVIWESLAILDHATCAEEARTYGRSRSRRSPN
jgi:glutathione S-transferase